MAAAMELASAQGSARSRVQMLEGGNVERAAVHVHAMISLKGGQGIERVGQYLFEELYGGDPARYHAAEPGQHAALRAVQALCAAMGLRVNRSTLWRAIGIAALRRELPVVTRFVELRPSHRMELLKVRDPRRVEYLAALVAESRMPVHRLRALVRSEVQRSSSTRGPKPVPEPLRAVRRAAALLRCPKSGRALFGAQDISRLTAGQSRELATLARELAELAAGLCSICT
jgi:hypothetical protein